MIKSVTITNEQHESIKLELFNPWSSGFVVTNIEGLGPVTATINMKELATRDGAIFNSARVGQRNIVLSLLFLEDPTIEDTRLKSYRFFPVKKEVTILIETDNRMCETTGRIESNEPTIFSDAEGCQVSILCPNPYFFLASRRHFEWLGWKPLFEFPFSNESLTDPLLEIGAIFETNDILIDYDGDCDIGLTFKIHSYGYLLGFAIHSARTHESIRLDDEKIKALTGSYIQPGDDIEIVTTVGKKNATLYRVGKAYNIMNALVRPLKWLQVTKGQNVFTFTAEEDLTKTQVICESDTLYGGV